jgi:hypothetical protein
VQQILHVPVQTNRRTGGFENCSATLTSTLQSFRQPHRIASDWQTYCSIKELHAAVTYSEVQPLRILWLFFLATCDEEVANLGSLKRFSHDFI